MSEDLPIPTKSDVKADVQKDTHTLSIKVETTDGTELSHEQSLSGMIAAYCEMCRQLNINYLEYFLDEFGIKHHIEYQEPDTGAH